MKAQSEKKHGSDKEERGKLPESPKTAEEIWQQSVIGDYLARFKVRSGLGRELGVGPRSQQQESPRAFSPAVAAAVTALGAVGRMGLSPRASAPRSMAEPAVAPWCPGHV